MRAVVLVSGLWVPAAGMALVAARLRRAGFSPRTFAYYGRDSFARNVEQLAAFARALGEGEPPCFVGHSLGGVLVFDMLSERGDVAAGTVVLLGAPVCGSLAGRRLADHAAGRWLLGGCAARWSEREATWRRSEPLGVIGGTRPLGLGRVLGRLPGDNDGVVCVDETTVTGMAGRALVHESHSMLALSANVAVLVRRFLIDRCFA